MQLLLFFVLLFVGTLAISNAFHLEAPIIQYAAAQKPSIYQSLTGGASVLDKSSSSLLLAALEPQGQLEQMRDAMVLKAMTGTEWRVFEDRTSAMGGGKQKDCSSTVVFNGFVEEPNKGIMKYKSSCGEQSSGRWITKPSEIRRGAVQLSARWKVKLESGQFIYKGFIQALPTVGKNGAIQAEMTGLILTGDEVGKEKLVGKFRADLVRQFEPTEKIGGEGSGPISVIPK